MAKSRNKPNRRLSPTVRFDVTAEVIAQATQRSSSHCMIADALRAHLLREDAGRYTGVSVDLYTVSFTDRHRNLRYHYDTPRVGQLGLIDFDRGNVPQPFSLELKAARKITRRRVFAKPGESADELRERVHSLSNGHKSEAAARRHVRAQSAGGAEKLRSTLDLLKLVADPTEPLGPPRHVEQRSFPDGTVVGGKPPAISNFAKTRRFGMRQLVE